MREFVRIWYVGSFTKSDLAELVSVSTDARVKIIRQETICENVFVHFPCPCKKQKKIKKNKTDTLPIIKKQVVGNDREINTKNNIAYENETNKFIIKHKETMVESERSAHFGRFKKNTLNFFQEPACYAV